MFGRTGRVHEPTGFNKFVRNEKWHMDVAFTDQRMEFEHLRYLQMARRVEGRKPGIVPPLPPYIKP